MRGHPYRATVALLLLTLACGCGTIELAPPPEDPPLFRRIDARVGVVHTSAARTAAIVNPLMRIDVGRTSVQHFDRAFASMFSWTTPLPDWPPWRTLDPDAHSRIDAVIELAQVDAELVLGKPPSGGGVLFGGLTGGLTGGKPDVVRLGYRICLHEPDGAEIRCWSISSQQVHQRQELECLDLRACIGPQVEIALREALARFLLEAEGDPVLAAWSARLRQRVPNGPR
jgi:hypothetical protein